MSFVATCGAGLESLVIDEITSFGGANITSSPGAVSWTGNLETGYKACLWSRFASRILLELVQFPVKDTDSLYHHASKIEWDEHFTGETSFAVYCTLTDAELTHSHYASLRIKDAVVDQFRNRTGKRPDIDVHSPGIRLNLHVKKTTATLSLDLSGDSLHRRGYRATAGEAPLKETLAAAIVQLSGWQQQADETSYLIDPMCGSGTLLIEAAMMLGDSAPGLQRRKFGFMFWNKHNPKLWEKLVNEALEREEQGHEKPWPTFMGYDADPRMVAAARKNVEIAGLGDVIVIKQRQLAKLQCPGPHGFVLTNPPYGERLSEKEAVKYLYRCLGRIFNKGFSNWGIGFFTANPDLAEMVRIPWQERYRLYNGPLKCRLLVGESAPKKAREPHQWSLTDTNIEGPGEDFANRLRKNCESLLPWARQEDITCFRIYDADIPEYNLAIDLYEEWIHVQEYAPPSSIDREKASQRFTLALQIIRSLFDARRSRLFIKTRQKQKGSQQYQKKKGSGSLYEVREGGGRFLLNFTDYLDTGLFLDHRITRAKIGELARGRTFLNLFGYTGSATVYAAMGEATSTTTVDVSGKYLGRAMANLSLNGFGGPLHQFFEADCIQWLHKNRERYGLIFVDPPTFSNRRHQKETFDIQKDHEQLLHLAMQRLSINGVLLFSTNFRKFKLAPALDQEFIIKEISNQTLPLDFQRNKNIHRCWQFEHRQGVEE